MSGGAHGLPVLRFVGHGPSDQLGPVSAPLSEPAAAAAVGEAMAAVPLPRFVLLAEQVAGDQRFGEVTGCSIPVQGGESGTALRRDSWDEFLQERGRNFRQQVRRFPRKLPNSGRCRIASPLTPSGSSKILTLCSVFTGSVGATPLTLVPARGAVSSRVRRAGVPPGLAATVVPRDRRQARCRALRLPLRRRRVGLPVRKRSGLPAAAGRLRPSRACRARGADATGWASTASSVAVRPTRSDSPPATLVSRHSDYRAARQPSCCSRPRARREGARSAYGGFWTGSSSRRRWYRGCQPDLVLPDEIEDTLRIMRVDRKNVRCPPSGRLRSGRRL